jgi:hypothetical protein
MEEGVTMPKVSVVIPTHNRAEVVGEAVESVLEQTYRDFEIIVVDDGSTDSTPAAVGRYLASHRERVRYLWQENAGAPAARNAGMRVATGDYVAFLDSDDLYLPRRLEVGVGALEADPGCGASYVDQRTLDASGDVLLASRISRFGGPASGWILPALLRGDLIQTNTITIRRQVLDAVGGFDERLWSGQDTDLWWRIAERWPMACVQETLVVIRELESSLSRGGGTKADRVRRLSIWIEGQAKYLDLWTDAPFSVQRLLARRIWDLHHEKECLLSDLGGSDELPQVRSKMRELESKYGLRPHSIRRRLGRRCPGLHQLWRRAAALRPSISSSQPRSHHAAHGVRR